MKKAIQNFFKQFQPTYMVNAITYWVIPGAPVQKHENKYAFSRGEYDAAKEFYDKVVRKTEEMGYSPAEVLLIKGKNSVVESKQLGPVSSLSGMAMTSKEHYVGAA